MAVFLENAASSEVRRAGLGRAPISVTYEQPLNERIRNFLRLEHLLRSVEAKINGSTEWDNRAALGALIDVTDVLSRSDIKGELVKEMDRHGALLRRLQSNPGVDSDRLHETLATLEGVLRGIKDSGYQAGERLRRDELANAVKQRLAIPGGTCSFDVPAFHHWLNQGAGARITQLHAWFEDLRMLRDGISLVLRLIRDSVDATRTVALGGFLQQSLDPNASHQLIRIQVPAELGLFPEISAGRFRFTLRFLEQPDTAVRPHQTSLDVEFDLQCCVL